MKHCYKNHVEVNIYILVINKHITMHYVKQTKTFIVKFHWVSSAGNTYSHIYSNHKKTKARTSKSYLFYCHGLVKLGEWFEKPFDKVYVSF